MGFHPLDWLVILWNCPVDFWAKGHTIDRAQRR